MPVTTIGDIAPLLNRVSPLAVQVTPYAVIGEPPSNAGAVNDTEAWALPGVADTPVTAPGAVTGLKFAVTARLAVMLTTHQAVPLQLPDQPVK